MSTAQQPDLETEDRALLTLGPLAQESLTLSFFGKREKTHYFLVTPHLYTEVGLSPAWLGGTKSICHSAGGTRYEKGMDAFVSKAVVDEKCGGLVPLTEEALNILTTKHNLRVVVHGQILEPENVRADAYGR